MEERISKEIGKRDVAAIKELNLDNCKSSNVMGLSEDWKSLEQLNLVNVGLTTLKGFPRLPNLKKLELSDNHLCEGLDALACLPKLEELNLSGNKMKDVDALQPLSQVSSLKSLNLHGCDISKKEDYRKKIFELLPSLVSIDGLDKEGKENKGSQVNGACDEEEEDSEIESSIDDEELEDEEEDEDEEDVPLEALYGNINDEGLEDDDDFEVVEEEEDDEDIDEEEEDDTSVNVSQDNSEETEDVRGTKRKHED